MLHKHKRQNAVLAGGMLKRWNAEMLKCWMLNDRQVSLVFTSCLHSSYLLCDKTWKEGCGNKWRRNTFPTFSLPHSGVFFSSRWKRNPFWVLLRLPTTITTFTSTSNFNSCKRNALLCLCIAGNFMPGMLNISVQCIWCISYFYVPIRKSPIHKGIRCKIIEWT